MLHVLGRCWGLSGCWRARLYLYARVSVCVRAPEVFAYVCAHKGVLCVWESVWMGLYVCVCLYVSTYVFGRVCLCVCRRVCVCVRESSLHGVCVVLSLPSCPRCPGSLPSSPRARAAQARYRQNARASWGVSINQRRWIYPLRSQACSRALARAPTVNSAHAASAKWNMEWRSAGACVSVWVRACLRGRRTGKRSEGKKWTTYHLSFQIFYN